jgi:hypothetical protein
MDESARKLAWERTIKEFMSRRAEGRPPASGISLCTDLPDDVLAAIMELEMVRDDSSNPDEAACAHVPVKPDPHLNSGAIALPTPE